jgi:hypothetical protein
MINKLSKKPRAFNHTMAFFGTRDKSLSSLFDKCIFFLFFGIYGAMGCGHKSLMLVWQCHQLLPEFVAKGHLSRMSCQSHLSVNGKDENEMIPGAVHRYHGICLMAEEKSARRPFDEGYVTSHCLKRGILPPNEVSRTT